jgi:quercetin dioxygenase-like cupin family protein
MQVCIMFIQTLTRETASLIHKMEPDDLANVPFHQNTPDITRFIARFFPHHLAVHEISPVHKQPETYTFLHKHVDYDEINIIISPGKLVYRIQLDNDEYIVNNNSSIWIPRGVMHSANVLEGAGYFIAMRVN